MLRALPCQLLSLRVLWQRERFLPPSLFCQRLLEKKLVFAAAVGLQPHSCPVSNPRPCCALGAEFALSAVSPMGLKGCRCCSLSWELPGGIGSPQPSLFLRPTLWHRDLLSWSLLLWLELGQILLCWVGSPKSLLLPLASHPSCSVPATADP